MLTKRHYSMSLAVLSLAALTASGCTFGRDFRAAAGPELESGVHSILTGLVNGLFAAIEPEPETETAN